MDFSAGMGISSLNDYIRQQSLQKKFDSGRTDKSLQEEARKNRQLKEKEAEPEPETPAQKKQSEDKRMIESIVKYMEDYNSDESRSRQRLGIIMAKMSGGGTVSASDIAFLKKHSPETYEKICNASKAKKELAKKLRRCKTKPQVLHMRTEVTQAAIIPNSSAGKYSPNATVSDMVSLTGVQSYQYHAMSSEWNQFTRSKAYQKLPYNLKRLLQKTNKKI